MTFTGSNKYTGASDYTNVCTLNSEYMHSHQHQHQQQEQEQEPAIACSNLPLNGLTTSFSNCTKDTHSSSCHKPRVFMHSSSPLSSVLPCHLNHHHNYNRNQIHRRQRQRQRLIMMVACSVITILSSFVIPYATSFPLHPLTTSITTTTAAAFQTKFTSSRIPNHRNTLLASYDKSQHSSATTKTSTLDQFKNNLSQEERILFNRLNRYRNQIVNASKQRYQIFRADASKNESSSSSSQLMNDEYYYNHQKKKIVQMMNMLQSFQLELIQKQQQQNQQQSQSQLRQQSMVYNEASRIMDSTMRLCTNEAFQMYSYQNKKQTSMSYNNNNMSLWNKIKFGLEVMELQLSTMIISTTPTSSSNSTIMEKKEKLLASPYDTIPQSVCLQALKALNVLLMRKRSYNGNNNTNNGTLPSSNSPTNNTVESKNPQIQQSYAAFRILQRLCTGNGIRTNHSPTSTSSSTSTTASPGKVQINLDERDFNMVLNGFINTNQMHQAHRVIALQVRTPHAPPLSPITYSILLKGYGRLKDVRSVELCMKQCYDHGIKPDIIMYNSLMDAYVNCNEIQLAYDIFEFLTMGRHRSRNGNGGEGMKQRGNNGKYRPKRYYGSENQPYQLYGQEKLSFDGSLSSSASLKSKQESNLNDDDHDEEENLIPTPNVRTYNIMLKGFVKDENINQAMRLSSFMKQHKLWDDITTNTLVSVAVATQDFKLAESILTNHTNYWKDEEEKDDNYNNNDQKKKKKRRRNKRNFKPKQHPNVEAYTELLDGYAKSRNLNKALSILQIMRNRGVNPNEYTYTCMIGALAKAQKIDQAKKLMGFMYSHDGISPGVITYNAFLAGMLEKYIIAGGSRRSGGSITSSEDENDMQDSYFNSRVEQATEIFETMMKSSNEDDINNGAVHPNVVYPNVITATTMIDAYGRCKPPRITEAKQLVSDLDERGLVPSSNQRLSTALIRACANALDLDGIESTYKNIYKPDTISFNALIEGYCRCGKVKMALEAMADNNDNYRDSGTSSGSSSKCRFIPADVVTYTILISAIMKIGTSSASSRALLLYTEMKHVWKIMPDRALVDV